MHIYIYMYTCIHVICHPSKHRAKVIILGTGFQLKCLWKKTYRQFLNLRRET